MLLEFVFNTRNKTNNRKFEIGSLLPFQFEIGSLLPFQFEIGSLLPFPKSGPLKNFFLNIFDIIVIPLHLLHIIVMPAFFQALDLKRTQLNQKHISVRVLHLISQHLTVV